MEGANSVLDGKSQICQMKASFFHSEFCILYVMYNTSLVNRQRSSSFVYMPGQV